MVAQHRLLAPYASDVAKSRGRLFPEPASPTRSDFQRDRDRIVHCTAFRRLAHKTQVFVPHEGDHFRTRLTHTIEVAQIARALARALALDEDLAEAVALAHDLGHTPFGHTGEDALQAALHGQGGFDHNAQALRIVTALERRYARFDGLNLTWETLEGLVKHNGPLLDAQGRLLASDGTPVPLAILQWEARWPLELEDLREVDFLAGLIGEIAALHPGLERGRQIHELGRRIITRFIEDVIAQSALRVTQAGIESVAQVRGQNRAMVAFSPDIAAADRAIKGFLYPRMYRHPRVMRIRQAAAGVVAGLYARFFADPDLMPQEWARDASNAGGDCARVVADYIAGMTDRFALSEHERVVGPAPELR